jgi:prevent-host-death family protein
MAEYSLTEARARLPELLDRVIAGETVHITRHGKRVGVLVGNDVWMKTRRHDVLVQADELGQRIEAAKGKPFVPAPPGHWDVEAHIAEIRAGRDVDVWDRIERGE